MERPVILEIVMTQVNNLVNTFPDEQKFDVQENTVLFGKDSNVDSLSLVSLIVDMEAIFLDEYDAAISLTDDRAMTREISPFNTINTLTDYIYEITNEN